jgi:hypothetical protein
LFWIETDDVFDQDGPRRIIQVAYRYELSKSRSPTGTVHSPLLYGMDHGILVPVNHGATADEKGLSQSTAEQQNSTHDTS